MRRIFYIILSLCIIYLIFRIVKKINWNSNYEIGQVLDEFNGVKVYYNGGVSNSEGRNLTIDGYNIGMKYQCVEFVKRYYYEFLKHKMPDTYGNAIDFYDKKLKDGSMNLKRNLRQYSNPSNIKPEVNDILIFNKSIFNSYGHVAIISKVEDYYIEIIQQNPGSFANSREKIGLKQQEKLWFFDNDRILGRLSID
jgi:surface antigen